MAPGLSALWTLSASMVADVCDEDEVQTGERREGMFGAAYWWLFKLGLTGAQWISGFVLVASGFHVALGANQSPLTIWIMRFFFVFIPVIAFGSAISVISRFPITEEVAYANKKLLEERRGTLEIVD
jgi:GPH family glycoside/pentoside/hexuronide:cation symporter